MIIEGYKMILVFSKELSKKTNFIEANSCKESFLKINEVINSNESIDLAIIDFSMPRYSEENISNGADVSIYLKKFFPSCKIFILSGHGYANKNYSLS
jgi:DNA-binding NarL/FixJ family response regulator